LVKLADLITGSVAVTLEQPLGVVNLLEAEEEFLSELVDGLDVSNR
jgi:hypothetical protein